MRKILYIVAIFALSLPVVTKAANPFWADDLPVRQMTEEDLKILKSTIVSVLDKAGEGESAHWENGKTGAHGELTPRATFLREGRRCRELEMSNSARGRDNRTVITLCKQPDGDWKVESR